MHTLIGRYHYRAMSTVHTANVSEVHDVPFNIIIRPLVSQVDEEKVQSLVDTLKVPISFLFAYNFLNTFSHINVPTTSIPNNF